MALLESSIEGSFKSGGFAAEQFLVDAELLLVGPTPDIERYYFVSEETLIGQQSIAK
jgi:hypothetical protein